MQMNKKEQRELEESLLDENQLRQLRTFDQSVRRSNRKFYDNTLIIDANILDAVLLDNYGEESYP